MRDQTPDLLRALTVTAAVHQPKSPQHLVLRERFRAALGIAKCERPSADASVAAWRHHLDHVFDVSGVSATRRHALLAGADRGATPAERVALLAAACDEAVEHLRSALARL